MLHLFPLLLIWNIFFYLILILKIPWYLPFYWLKRETLLICYGFHNIWCHLRQLSRISLPPLSKYQMNEPGHWSLSLWPATKYATIESNSQIWSLKRIGNSYLNISPTDWSLNQYCVWIAIAIKLSGGDFEVYLSIHRTTFGIPRQLRVGRQTVRPTDSTLPKHRFKVQDVEYCCSVRLQQFLVFCCCSFWPLTKPRYFNFARIVRPTQLS